MRYLTLGIRTLGIDKADEIMIRITYRQHDILDMKSKFKIHISEYHTLNYIMLKYEKFNCWCHNLTTYASRCITKRIACA
jgi:hypothetical protein